MSAHRSTPLNRNQPGELPVLARRRHSDHRIVTGSEIIGKSRRNRDEEGDTDRPIGCRSTETPSPVSSTGTLGYNRSDFRGYPEKIG